MIENDEIFEGEVIWFRVKPGLGFIKWFKDGVRQTDMFVHYSGLNMSGFKVLKADQKVKFSIGKNNAGKPIAINVDVIE